MFNKKVHRIGQKAGLYHINNGSTFLQLIEREQICPSRINQELKHFVMQGHVPQNKQASKKLLFCGNSVKN